MIELRLKNNECADGVALMYITDILAWLTTALTGEEYKNITLSGYMAIHMSEGGYTCLILANDMDGEKILKVLQQPPPKYQEKYIACIVQENVVECDSKKDEEIEEEKEDNEPT